MLVLRLFACRTTVRESWAVRSSASSRPLGVLGGLGTAWSLEKMKAMGG